MLIRKLYKFEGAHIVRNCTSTRCSQSIHGHSSKVEVILESDKLDDGQMVYDFGLMKNTIHDLIDSFDHCIAYWGKDDPDYISFIHRHSSRWISLPFSPSAEQFAKFFLVGVKHILKKTNMANGEGDVKVHSVIYHETDTGYAQAFHSDITDEFEKSVLRKTEFSEGVMEEWKNQYLWDVITTPSSSFINTTPTHQVKNG